MSYRQPYDGPCRKLVIGIDVGTTFSGVSYSILDPGIVPVIQAVNRYPAQERVGGDAKIPSIIYYDRNGSTRAVGAECLLESNAMLAREEQWVKAEWFKLYLRPKHSKSDAEEEMPPLPLNKTVEQVFGDFLRYLYECTRQYIRETHAGGLDLWESLEGSTEFVLTHPNGWEGAQQSQMRSAAVYAGLIPGTPEGHARIKFVTEGEASLHYCIGNNYAIDVIKSGQGVLIIDAGGGTIDLSAFYMRNAPKEFEEITAATCYFNGSVYVSRRARTFLENKLYSSHYGSPDDIDHITDCFDKSTKLTFAGSDRDAYVRFGTARDTQPSFDIKFGQLKLEGSDVANFFEPSITAIKEGIKDHTTSAYLPITSVLLVGGFAASNWLFSNLQDHLQAQGLKFYRPDGHLGKAVSNGAVSFVVDHFVSVRVARVTFGISASTKFDASNDEHQRQIGTMYTDLSGEKRVPDHFSVIMAKGTRVVETQTFRHSYFRKMADQSKLSTYKLAILAYRGDKSDSQWVDVDRHLYSNTCTITADVKSAVEALPCRTGTNGTTYFQFDFIVEMFFGLTEHKAQICWKENGEEKRGPATIIYDTGPGKV